MLSSLPDWPLFGYADDMRPALADARARGLPAALVTLHTVEGGGLRPPGAQMLFAEGIVSGFLSGGCVEGDVALHAAETLADGRRGGWSMAKAVPGRTSACSAGRGSSSWWSAWRRMTQLWAGCLSWPPPAAPPSGAPTGNVAI